MGIKNKLKTRVEGRVYKTPIAKTQRGEVKVITEIVLCDEENMTAEQVGLRVREAEERIKAWKQEQK